MAMRILWPNLPARLVPVATEAVGSGFELQFHEKFEDVSDEQWAKADAIVGGCPPPYIDKLKACRIFVKDAVCRFARSGSSAWAGSAPRRRSARKPSTWTWSSTTRTSRMASSSRSAYA